MEDRRSHNKGQQLPVRLTNSTSRMGGKLNACQNCGLTQPTDCTCSQHKSIGSTGKLEVAQAKSPLKLLNTSPLMKEASRKGMAKQQPAKQKSVAQDDKPIQKAMAANQEQPSEQEICLIHNKPLDVVCTDDLTIICSSCAIFCHKGHDFKSVKEFETDKLRRCQDILDLTEEKRVIEEKLCSKAAKDKLERNFQKIKDKLVEEVKTKFSQLTDLLKEAQEKCIQRILRAVAVECDKARANMMIPPIVLQDFKQWQSHAYEQIKAFQNDHDLQLQMKMLNYDRKQAEDIVKRGNTVMVCLKNHYQVVSLKAEEGIKSLNLHFDSQIERRLSRYAEGLIKRSSISHGMRIDHGIMSTDELLLNEDDKEQDADAQPTFKALKMQQESPEKDPIDNIDIVVTDAVSEEKEVVKTDIPSDPVHSNDQQLNTTDNISLSCSSRIVQRELNLVQQNRSSIFETEKVKSLLPTAESGTASCIATMSRPRFSTLSRNNIDIKIQPSTTLLSVPSKADVRMVTSPEKLSSWPSVRSIMSPPKGKEASQEQKVKRVLQKLKLPEKYQKVATAVMSETIDTLDLSSCAIDQMQVVCIVELLKVNKSVKMLKLIRNRLTDDFVERILPFIGNVTTLNLSQNYLTEKSLDYIMAATNQLPSLRNVVLSQNRIREKGCKGKLDELKKMNITITF